MADALKTYGEIRTRVGVIVTGIVAMCMCICGWMIILGKDTRTAKTPGTLSNVECTSNACTATALYSVSGSPAPYSFQGTWPLNSKENQNITVYYDPANPVSASTGSVPKGFGWGLVICATLIILISILFMNFFSGLSNQGKAVVGGLAVAGDISSLLSKK